MTFFIGNDIGDINDNDMNVEVSDELIDYLYNRQDVYMRDMSALYNINPYDDEVIDKTALSEIIDICTFIIDNSVLNNYNMREEAVESISALKLLAQHAKEKDAGLVSIGD